MWMGWVTLIDKNGHSVVVDKSWGYKKLRNEALKIHTYNPSLPHYLPTYNFKPALLLVFFNSG